MADEKNEKGMKYEVVMAAFIGPFQEKVEKKLAEGFELVGGIAVVANHKGHTSYFYQAFKKPK